jgi:hypothetical protein
MSVAMNHFVSSGPKFNYHDGLEAVQMRRFFGFEPMGWDAVHLYQCADPVAWRNPYMLLSDTMSMEVAWDDAG